MENMYWILMLDGIVGLLLTLSIISVVILFVLVGVTCGIAADADTKEEAGKARKLIRSELRIGIPLVVIFILGTVFTPNTKQMLTIIGVGGTIEYVKNNDTIKELPDKCVMALDKFMDEYIKEDSQWEEE